MKRLLLCIVAMLSLTMSSAQQVSHTVVRGETLESIARKYHVSVDQLKAANPESDGMVYVGMKLLIPNPDASSVLPVQQEPIPGRKKPMETSAPESYTASDNKPFEIEVLAGASFNTYKGNSLSNVDMKIGFHAGVGIRYYFVDNVFVDGALMFATKGYKSGKSDNLVQLTTYNIELPVDIGYRFRLSDNIGLKIKVGPYITYAISGEMKDAGVTTKISDMKDFYKFNVGVGGGIALDIYKMTLSGTFQQGLMTQLKRPKIYEQNILVTIGYRF